MSVLKSSSAKYLGLVKNPHLALPSCPSLVTACWKAHPAPILIRDTQLTTTQAQLHKSSHEARLARTDAQIGRQRQRQAGAHSSAVHTAHDGLRQVAKLLDEAAESMLPWGRWCLGAARFLIFV